MGASAHESTVNDAQVAYARFFERESRALLRLAYLLLADTRDAEDVVQEVLEEVYRRWAEMRQDTVMAYARTSVVNRSRSLHRRRSVARRFAQRLVEVDEAPAVDVQDRWLWDLVQSLPRRQREVVVLRYWCDLSEAQIAKALNISPGTVKSSAHRAHTQLTAVLTDASGQRKDVP